MTTAVAQLEMANFEKTVFGVLEDLKTALDNDDTPNISGALTDLETYENRVLGARVKVGTWLKDDDVCNRDPHRDSDRA